MKKEYEFEQPVTFYLLQAEDWSRVIRKYDSVEEAIPNLSTMEMYAISKNIDKLWIYDDPNDEFYEHGEVNVRYTDGREDFWFMCNDWGVVFSGGVNKTTPVIYSFYDNFTLLCEFLNMFFDNEERNKL